MDTINRLSPVESWPTRKDPQERFDRKIQTTMEQLGYMVEELNSDFIPKTNLIINSINHVLTSTNIIYTDVRPTSVPDTLINNGLILYKEINSTDDFEVYQNQSNTLIFVGYISNKILHLDKTETITGKKIFSVPPEAITLPNEDSSERIATTRYVKTAVSEVNIVAEYAKSKSNNSVQLTDNQNISGIKTFADSPLIPTPEVNDVSQKGANTSFVMDAVNRVKSLAELAKSTADSTVKKSGDTMTGALIIRNETPVLTLTQSDISFGVRQTELQQSLIRFTDKDNKEISSINTGIHATNTTYCTLSINKNQISNTDKAELGIYYPPNGNPYTQAPNPPFNDDDTKIATTHFIRDELRWQTETISNGQNTVIRDKFGYPHIMVVIPKFNLQDIDVSLGTGVHPAFIVNGVVHSEIFIGKYLASKGNSDHKVKTLARKIPWVSINFEDAYIECAELGQGFGLCSRATYSARVLWLWKQFNNRTYNGNTSYGKSSRNGWQTGVMVANEYSPGHNLENVSGATLTGSGVIDWNDDGTPYGVSDLVGNVWEWESGFRLNDGEIQIIPDNNIINLSVDDTKTNSKLWKAILANNNLVDPKTTSTLKFDGPTVGNENQAMSLGAMRLVNNIAASMVEFNWAYIENFGKLTASSTLTIPQRIKQLAIYPIAPSNIQGQFLLKNRDERIPIRGGSWEDNLSAGPYSVNLNNKRSHSAINLGFRLHYINI